MVGTQLQNLLHIARLVHVQFMISPQPVASTGPCEQIGAVRTCGCHVRDQPPKQLLDMELQGKFSASKMESLDASAAVNDSTPFPNMENPQIKEGA